EDDVPRMTLPLLGLMLGDCTGIGPEQCARVLADRRVADAARLLVIGDGRVLEQGAKDAGVKFWLGAYRGRESVDWSCPDVTLADRTMRDAGIEAPRIAVCALNPHGGENGLFGWEEIEIIRPAVERRAKRGILCKGPYPSDTVFLKAFNGEFDGVLSMYHDQGQIATKLKGFNR